MVFLFCIHFWDLPVSSFHSFIFLFIPVSSGNGREALWFYLAMAFYQALFWGIVDKLKRS